MRFKRLLIGGAAAVVGGALLTVVVALLVIAYLDETSGTLVSHGKTREYLLHVPDSYDPATPTPLVISLHGGAVWPAHQRNLTGWNRLADEHGFVVAYPAASGFPKVFETFSADGDIQSDVGFISDLIDALASTYNIDRARVYADGMSNGGGMAFVLGCELADRIAAVGMVATAQSLPHGWCEPARPVPLLAFHGVDDEIVPYEGGLLGDPLNPVKPDFPPVREWVGDWAQRNDCADPPVESSPASDVIRLEYERCAESASVVLYTIAGGGHTWPGGKPLPAWWVGPTSTAVDATEQLWDFFQRHTLPAPRHDLHVHIRSAAAAEIWADPETGELPAVTTAADALAAMDAAGIDSALVLSLGYAFGEPSLDVANEAEKVRAENDYLVAETASAPARLEPACGVNPLAEYALTEVSRCLEDLGVRVLKLHFTNSEVDLRAGSDLTRLREVFGELQRHGAGVIVHMRTGAEDYGAVDARNFIEQVLVAFPDVPVQVAHMAGWGGYDDATDAALGEFVAAIEDGRLESDRVWFGLGAVVFSPDAAGDNEALAQSVRDANAQLLERIREVGIDRVTYATDWPGWPPTRDRATGIAANLRLVSGVLGLSPAEFDAVVENPGLLGALGR